MKMLRSQLWLALLVALIFAFIINAQATSLVVLDTYQCEDSTAPSCQIKFSLTTPNPTETTIVDVVSQNWVSNIKNAISVPTTACTILGDTAVRLQFPAGQKTLDCWFGLNDDILQTSVIAAVSTSLNPTQVTQQLSLPALSYYPQGFVWNNPTPSCADSTSLEPCQVELIMPTKLAQWSLITPDDVTFTCTPTNGIITYSNTPQRITKSVADELEVLDHVGASPNDITFEINRYNFIVNTKATIALTEPPSCKFIINKSSGIAPYFKITTSSGNNNQQDDIVIFQTTNELMTTQIELVPQADCADIESALCTIEYHNVPVIHNFKVYIPFFSATYDNFPVLLSPQSKIYMQRFVKAITATSTASYNSASTSPVFIYSHAIAAPQLTLNIERFAYTTPIHLEYDIDICKDPFAPICPMVIRSTYVGYPSAIRLTHIPLTGVVENIKCNHESMVIFEANPTELHFSSSLTSKFTTKASDALTFIDALTFTTEGYFECRVNIAIAYDGNEFNNEKSSITNNIFAINEVVLYYPTVSSLRSTVVFPQLQRDEVIFNQLPFTVTTTESCLQQHTPYCGLRLIFDPNGPAFANATTLEEKQAVLEKVYMRRITLPLYKLREPLYEYGQMLEEVVSVTITDTNLVRSTITNVEWKRQELGYDTITLEFSTFLDIMEYNAYFKNDPNDKTKKIPFFIDINFEMALSLDDNGIVYNYDDTFPIQLLGYNGVKTVEYQPLLYTSAPGEIYWAQTWSFHVDVATCNNPNHAFCPIIMQYYNKRSKMTGISVDLIRGHYVRSILIELPSSAVIDASEKLTSNELSFELVSPRQIYNEQTKTTTLNPYLYLNVTVPAPEDLPVDVEVLTYKLVLIKRIGADSIGRFTVVNYTATKDIYGIDENTGEEIVKDTIWLTDVMPYFYIVTRIYYQGDMKFTLMDDCADPASIICSANVYLVTNDIYPGQVLLRFDTAAIFQGFYSMNQPRCIGIDGIDPDESAQYISVGIKLATMMLSITATTKEDDKFNKNKPLHYNTQERSYILCEIAHYKYQKANYYTPSVYPIIYHDVQYGIAPYDIYPVPHTIQGLSLKYGTLKFMNFFSEPLDDCRTHYLTNAKCTTRWGTNTSTLYPLKFNPWATIKRVDYMKQATLALQLAQAQFYFSSFCITGSKKPSESILPQGTPINFMLTDDLNVIVTNIIFTTYEESQLDNLDQVYQSTIDLNNYQRFFGLYTTTWSLCDNTSDVKINFNIAPYYKTNPGTGYTTQKIDFTSWSKYNFILSDVIQPRLSYQLMVNIPEVIDPTVKYSYFEPDPAVIKASPDRAFFPAMLFNKLFSLNLSQTRVYGQGVLQSATSQQVELTFNLFYRDIESITVNTVLGPFVTPQAYQYCMYPLTTPLFDKDNQEIRNDVVLGKMYTDLTRETTVLSLNTTLLTTLFDQQPKLKDTGLSCTVYIPVNRLYPYNSMNVLHTTKITSNIDGAAQEFLSNWNYPTYQNDAQLQSAAILDTVNAATLTTTTATFSVVLFVIVNIVMMMMF